MAHLLLWLPEVLLNAGLKVATVDGWENRGKAMETVVGVICHHTAGSANGNMPSLNTLVNGRPGLPGPLSQLGLGRDGTYYVIAAGKCNHAGPGIWQGFVNANANFIGVEAEHTGRVDERWPDVQMDAYRRGVAAILRHVGQPVNFCAGHKEYRLPAGFKTDPTFDMQQFRLGVAGILSGAGSVRPPIPRVEPSGRQRPTLRRDDEGEHVRFIQQKLALPVDGVFGAKTEAAVRKFQRLHSLVPDGIFGPKSWKVIDTL